MKLLVCYEMSHNKGLTTGDAVVAMPDDTLTQAVLGRVRVEVRKACEDHLKADGLVPVGKLVFRSVVKLDD